MSGVHSSNFLYPAFFCIYSHDLLYVEYFRVSIRAFPCGSWPDVQWGLQSEAIAIVTFAFRLSKIYLLSLPPTLFGSSKWLSQANCISYSFQIRSSQLNNDEQNFSHCNHKLRVSNFICFIILLTQWCWMKDTRKTVDCLGSHMRKGEGISFQLLPLTLCSSKLSWVSRD